MKALQGIQKPLNVAAGQIRSESRQKNVDLTCGLIQRYFIEREPTALDHGIGSAIPFENSIRRSRIESSAYECKQGLLRLDSKREWDKELLERLTQTTCAIANIGPDQEGAIFIGVADSQKDKERVELIDGIQSAHIGSRFVVGVDREAKIMSLDLDNYKKLIVDKFRKCLLSEPLKSAVLSRIDCIVYRGLSVICIWIPPQKTYSHVNERVFAREGSSTKEVIGASAMSAVFRRFPSLSVDL